MTAWEVLEFQRFGDIRLIGMYVLVSFKHMAIVIGWFVTFVILYHLFSVKFLKYTLSFYQFIKLITNIFSLNPENINYREIFCSKMSRLKEEVGREVFVQTKLLFVHIRY